MQLNNNFQTVHIAVVSRINVLFSKAIRYPTQKLLCLSTELRISDIGNAVVSLAQLECIVIDCK